MNDVFAVHEDAVEVKNDGEESLGRNVIFHFSYDAMSASRASWWLLAVLHARMSP